jgi:hypothetical protein
MRIEREDSDHKQEKKFHSRYKYTSSGKIITTQISFNYRYFPSSNNSRGSLSSQNSKDEIEIIWNCNKCNLKK